MAGTSNIDQDISASPLATITESSKNSNNQNIFRRFGHWIWSSGAIEFPVLIFATGLALGLVDNQSIMTSKICANLYGSDPVVDCQHLKQFPDENDKCLAQASTWNLYLTIAATLTSVPAMLLWSAWADMTGDRKLVLIIPMLGFIGTNFIFLIEAAVPGSPIWLLVLIHLLLGCLGGQELLISSAAAYLQDMIGKNDSVSARFSITMLFFFGGFIIGGLLNSALLKVWSISGARDVALAFMLVGIAWMAIGVPQPNRKTVLKSFRLEDDRNGNEYIGQQSNESETMSPASDVQHVSNGKLKTQESVVSITTNLLRDSFKAYVRPRDGNKRRNIFILLVAVFFTNVGNDGTRGHSKYLFLNRTPFYWGAARYSIFSSISMAMQVVGMVTVTLLMKRLHFRDTSLAIVATLSVIAQCLVFGASTESWMVWLSAALGSVANASYPAVPAILLRLVGPTERGRIVAGNGVAQGLAALISAAVFSEVFKASVDYLPGLAWFVSAGLATFALILLIFLHFSLKRTEPFKIATVAVHDQCSEQSSPPTYGAVSNETISSTANEADGDTGGIIVRL